MIANRALENKLDLKTPRCLVLKKIYSFGNDIQGGKWEDRADFWSFFFFLFFKGHNYQFYKKIRSFR